LIADEPTTALDVTIQAQILELIGDIQSQLGLAVMLITHDLAVVAGICHRVHVMYAGKLVEQGTADEVFARPAHPYTAGLLTSTPRLDVVVPKLQTIDGSPPDLRDPPPGCPFQPRCKVSDGECCTAMPALAMVEGRLVACRHPYTVTAGTAHG
jgi:peptide/nickel transport system ATP-binding protein